MMVQPSTTMIKILIFRNYLVFDEPQILENLRRNLRVFLLISVWWVDICCTLTICLTCTRCIRERQMKANTAISRKVDGKSTRDNPERYCGWFWIHSYSKKFERMTREATEVCLRVLKESNKSRFDSYSVRNSVLITSLITFRDCRVHILSDDVSRNSCI